MKTEIIQNPSGTFAVYAGQKLLGDHFKIRADAEFRGATHESAVALGQMTSPAKSAAAIENGKKGGRPKNQPYLIAVEWVWIAEREDGSLVVDPADGRAWPYVKMTPEIIEALTNAGILKTP